MAGCAPPRDLKGSAMGKRVFLVCLVLLGALVGRAQTKSVDGNWRGAWTNTVLR